MLNVVTDENNDIYGAELDPAFRLRDKVFVEGWTDLKREDGQETDRFDDEHAVHMLYIAGGRVIG